MSEDYFDDGYYDYGNYYHEEGCCLTCEEARTGCLCYRCRCTKCSHYESGHCLLAVGQTWEDHEQNARRELERAITEYGKEPHYLKATFSNGTITQLVYYCNAVDIPYKSKYRSKEGYPYRYRTLLLKKIEPWVRKV